MRRHQLLPLLALTLAFGSVPARVSHAQWQVNGVPVCTALSAHELPTVVSDGAGGAIVTWYDFRSGINVYAQRLNAAGVRQWPDSGVALCTAGGVTYYGGEPGPAIVPDGAGGAIVAWYDNRIGNGNFDIYAQRVNAAGATLWGEDGVALCDDTSAQYSPTIASDGAGGAIVTWLDYRNPDVDIYSQRVDAAGAPQWTDDGVALCTVLGAQYNPMIASDGAGGAIVTWYDYRGPSIDIYAQRVSAAGAAQWTIGGVALCTNENYQYYPMIVSDGAGGAIVAWTDDRNTYPIHNIYAQRVNSAGATQWTTDGVSLQAVTSNQRAAIVEDGAGGAIVTWQDYRGTDINIHAQRVSANGALQWAPESVALCTAENTQYNPAIASDGAGGAVVTWWDNRSGVPYPADIYAQRVNEAGAPEWTAGGVALCTVDNQQAYPTIVSDGEGGAIVAWQDSRGGVQASDIYAQRVYGSGGIVAVPPPSAPTDFLLLALSPNPTRDGQLTIRFNLPSSGRVSAEVLDLAGHLVRTLATDREFSPGPQALDWDGRNDVGVRLSSGVYFVQVRDGTRSEARRAILLH